MHSRLKRPAAFVWRAQRSVPAVLRWTWWNGRAMLLPEQAGTVFVTLQHFRGTLQHFRGRDARRLPFCAEFGGRGELTARPCAKG